MSNVMDRMVFVTGFARGGTSWLRDCIGSHPNVAALPRERLVFRDLMDPQAIRSYFERETVDIRADARLIVNKAPANAPNIGFAARSFPESKFVFIIRDPRDVLVSHQRGAQEWMGGANSTVEGCMKKIEAYYRGWQEAKDLKNVLLVRYEDLHQNFFVTMKRVLDFIEISSSPEILASIYQLNNFKAQTKRSNTEDRNSAKRKGVIGEWAVNLSGSDKDWYKRSKFFTDFMKDQDYHWKLNIYENILQAMLDAGANFLTEEDLHQFRLDPKRINIALQHDIDYLNKEASIQSVRDAADINAKYNIPSAFNFLPLDDNRYKPDGTEKVVRLVNYIRERAPNSYLGLHLNAFEKYYPPDAPEILTDDFPFRDEIGAYIDRMVDDYDKIGVYFKTATAHGYGRGNKLPNNKGTPLVVERLSNHGITLFDVGLRPKIKKYVPMRAAITDVGGTLKSMHFTSGFELTDQRLYKSFPPGTFIRFLSHPGNYPVDKPLTVIMRAFWTKTSAADVNQE